VKNYSLRSINSLLLFVIKKICLISGRSLSLYQFRRKGVKVTVGTMIGYHLLSTSHKLFSSILLSSLSPYTEEVIGDHQCGFWCNIHYWSIFFICQVLEKKWEYNETVHELIFMDLRKPMIQLKGNYCTIFS
jgi:hypothetical protein